MAPSTPELDDVSRTDPVPAQMRDGDSAVAREPGFLSAGRVLVLIGAIAIVTLGLAGSLLGLGLALLAQGNERLTAATVSISILALTVGLGLSLAWQAWRAMQGVASTAFRPRSPWPLAAAFLLAVTAGQAVLQLGLLAPLLFPPFHLVAALTPPLIILALVARGLGGAGRWRDTVLHLSSGAFLATPLAFLVEGALIFGVAALLVVGLTLRPGGPEMLQALAESPWLQDPENLAPLLTTPAIILAALLVTALFVPLVEELAKAMGVGLVAYRQPDARQAMMWGLAGGAGFAMVEGLLNTAGSLSSWAPVIVLRVGATLLHCTAGALMGLAWRQLLVLKRWWPALRLYAASAGLHAAWNTVSVGVTFLSLGDSNLDAAGAGDQMAALGTSGLVVFLVALTAGMAVLLWTLTRRLARRGQAGEQTADLLPPDGG